MPGRSVIDAQRSAEYVAYGVQYLAPKSSTGKVSIIGHSQGAGLNPQWALSACSSTLHRRGADHFLCTVFWPSIRPLVTNYVGLAPDFHGTVQGLLFCNPLKLGTYVRCLLDLCDGQLILRLG